VDIANAVYQALKGHDPKIEFWFPHIGLGGTRTIADRQRPLRWSWDHDYLDKALGLVDGWDRVMTDWGVVDYTAVGAAEGVANPDLIATWTPNWGVNTSDALEMIRAHSGPTKPVRQGWIEWYAVDVNLTRFSSYTPEQVAAFEMASLFFIALAGGGPVFGWQKEGGYSGGFQHYFGWFQKTAIPGGANPQTGALYPAGHAVKAVHDLLPVGVNIWPVDTGDPRVFGIATPDITAIVNCGSGTWADTVEGQQIALAPYTWVFAPAQPPQPPDPGPLPAPEAFGGVACRLVLTWSAVEGAAAYEISVSGKPIKRVPGTQTETVIAKVAAHTTLKFGVRAVDANGELGTEAVIFRTTMD
jgi:hypothetical protein